jgi:C4-dicarboxylate-specific signal transduction histidine kinase
MVFVESSVMVFAFDRRASFILSSRSDWCYERPRTLTDKRGDEALTAQYEFVVDAFEMVSSPSNWFWRSRQACVSSANFSGVP